MAAGKNKATVYFLGALLVIIWGTIFYRVYDALQGDDDMVIPQTSAPVKKEVMNDRAIVKDTATLKLNYRNPFATAEHKASATDTSVISVSKLIKPVQTAQGFNRSVITGPAAINWSFIQFTGYIRNPRTKKLLALVTINGKPQMLSEGETAGAVKLLKNYKDSIKVSYQNHTKYIQVSSGS